MSTMRFVRRYWTPEEAEREASRLRSSGYGTDVRAVPCTRPTMMYEVWRTLKLHKPYIVGGRRRYATVEAATAAADEIHRTTGVIASVEHRPQEDA